MDEDMHILEGVQRRLRVRLESDKGEVLPPGNFRVYGGAFCPGCAPAHFAAERTAEEWVLTMPGLKPGRVPWSWQVIAAEYATGVEWLLAAGEVTVTPRHATGSGYVDPGELKITATLDKTTVQMTVQVGESTSACSLAVVDARNSAKAADTSAKAAANSAEHAAEHAAAADKAAQTAGEKATEAGGHAAAAGKAAQTAGEKAAEAGEHAAAAGKASQTAGEKATEAGEHAAAAGQAAQTAGEKAAEAGEHAAAAGQSAQTAGEKAAEAGEHAAAAGKSAQTAGEKATEAGEHAEAAGKSAQTAGEKATAAEGSAKAAADSEAAAAKSADSAASTLNAAAKKGENNTFTGTNTFNGVLVANQGVKVNYVEPAFNSVLPSNAMSPIGLLYEAIIKEINVKGSLVSSTGAFSDGLELSGGTAEAPAVMQKKYNAGSFHNGYKSYADYQSFVVPIESNNSDFRVMLAMNNTGNAYTVQYSDITKPFFPWETPPGYNSHFHVFEVYVTYRSGQQSIHCTTRWREGDNVHGVREFGARLNNGNLSSNYTGITHLFFMRESNGVGLYVLFSSASIRFMRVGSCDYRHGLYSSAELKTLLVGTTGRVKLKNMKMVAAIDGAGYPNFPYPLSKTYDAYENFLTFDEYKQKYGITE